MLDRGQDRWQILGRNILKHDSMLSNYCSLHKIRALLFPPRFSERPITTHP
jgi:hypothetical protein